MDGAKHTIYAHISYINGSQTTRTIVPPAVIAHLTSLDVTRHKVSTARVAFTEQEVANTSRSVRVDLLGLLLVHLAQDVIDATTEHDLAWQEVEILQGYLGTAS
jgi:hypothetical protein